MNYMQYTVTIETIEPHGPAMLIAVDASNGSPVVTDVAYRRGESQQGSILAPWEGLDVDAIAALLPKAGTGDWVDDEPVEKIRETFERLPKAVTKAPTGGAAGPVVEALREDILRGKYPVGKKLPTKPELVKVIPGATNWSIKVAIQTLQAEGLLAPGQRAKGILVLDGHAPARKAAPPQKTLNPRENQAPPDAEVLAAFRKALENYGQLARNLGVSYSTARTWVTLAKRRKELAGRPIVRDAA